jgi:type I restriction enzyme S subunit
MKRKGIFTTENTESTEVDAVASVRSVVNTDDLPDNFHMTELGPLPEDWRVVRLGEVFDILQGKSLSAKQNKGVRPRPFLRTSNVYWGYLDLSKLDVMDFTEEEEQRFALQRGDLLVCEGGDVGRTAMWEGQMQGVYYQNHLHRLRARDNNVHPVFVMYWLQTAFTLLNLYSGSSNKTTIPNLSQGRLAVFPIPLPPLPEQRAIAHVLRTVQRAKEATEGVIAALKELKKSLMQHLFTYGPIPVTEREQVELQESEIGPLPSHWRVVRLGEVAEKPQYGFTAAAQRDPVGPKMMRITDIQDGNVNWNAVPYCECGNDDIPKYLLEAGDILFARTGSVGKAFLVSSVPEPSIFASYLIRVRVDRTRLDPQFAFLFMQSAAYWSQIASQTHGAVQPNVNATQLRSLLLPLPPLDEQREIARILQAVDAKIAAEQARREALEGLFKTLLQELMSGKRRVGCTTENTEDTERQNISVLPVLSVV